VVTLFLKGKKWNKVARRPVGVLAWRQETARPENNQAVTSYELTTHQFISSSVHQLG